MASFWNTTRLTHAFCLIKETTVNRSISYLDQGYVEVVVGWIIEAASPVTQRFVVQGFQQLQQLAVNRCAFTHRAVKVLHDAATVHQLLTTTTSSATPLSFPVSAAAAANRLQRAVGSKHFLAITHMHRVARSGPTRK